jgi:hypothetical protein
LLESHSSHEDSLVAKKPSEQRASDRRERARHFEECGVRIKAPREPTAHDALIAHRVFNQRQACVVKARVGVKEKKHAAKGGGPAGVHLGSAIRLACGGGSCAGSRGYRERVILAAAVHHDRFVNR